VLWASPSLRFRFRPPTPLANEPVATLSTEGDLEKRSGEPTPSASGEKAFRSCEGFRFFAVEEMLETEVRLRGMLSCGR
jgi:hypothetical protein